MTRNVIPDMCLRGETWHTFLFGPLLLGLPWVGRNVIIADIHSNSKRPRLPAIRWKTTLARFLCHDARLGADAVMSFQGLDMTDGLLIFHAFGQDVDPLHLIAYDSFISEITREATPPDGLCYSKACFSRFWEDLRSGRRAVDADARRAMETYGWPQDFSAAKSPYESAPGGAQSCATTRHDRHAALRQHDPAEPAVQEQASGVCRQDLRERKLSVWD